MFIKHIFAISTDETSVKRRGFDVEDEAIQHRLELIGQTFLAGYHAALAQDTQTALVGALNGIEKERRGFAFEGAGMGLALRDMFTPSLLLAKGTAKRSRSQLVSFIDGVGFQHRYLMYVGAGWLAARLRWPMTEPPAHFHPLLGWLALDGYGFHEGYFRWQHYLAGQPVPSRISGPARPVFDQGLGRSLWFVKGANVNAIVKTIAAFPQDRQADLWSGVGLASAYAGGAKCTDIVLLAQAADCYRPHLAQGVAFAAKARISGGNLTEQTEQVCELICHCTAAEAARITDIACQGLDQGNARNSDPTADAIRASAHDSPMPLPDESNTCYALWRNRIRSLIPG